ncbi:YlxM family DNA-binding protein [Ruminococcus sp.]|uniref:YlxM family DNA-binding protein n=1 Tax=Ruminococcus sp. TaxID=41978 RepID=UPI002872D122|nr:sigma factor-like helix-turn-helix DNA-binding protein [Ruminococcus sp.]
MLYREDENGSMNSKTDISLLYDFYGELLKTSQQQVVELYVNEDLSLSEVAEILGISRQGVRDSLNRAEKKLLEYESKLGLTDAYHKRRARSEAVRRIIDEIKTTEGCGAILPQLNEIEELMRGDD